MILYEKFIKKNFKPIDDVSEILNKYLLKFKNNGF